MVLVTCTVSQCQRKKKLLDISERPPWRDSPPTSPNSSSELDPEVPEPLPTRTYYSRNPKNILSNAAENWRCDEVTKYDRSQVGRRCDVIHSRGENKNINRTERVGFKALRQERKTTNQIPGRSVTPVPGIQRRTLTRRDTLRSRQGPIILDKIQIIEISKDSYCPVVSPYKKLQAKIPQTPERKRRWIKANQSTPTFPSNSHSGYIRRPLTRKFIRSRQGTQKNMVYFSPRNQQMPLYVVEQPQDSNSKILSSHPRQTLLTPRHCMRKQKMNNIYRLSSREMNHDRVNGMTHKLCRPTSPKGGYSQGKPKWNNCGIQESEESDEATDDSDYSSDITESDEMDLIRPVSPKSKIPETYRDVMENRKEPIHTQLYRYSKEPLVDRKFLSDEPIRVTSRGRYNAKEKMNGRRNQSFGWNSEPIRIAEESKQYERFLPTPDTSDERVSSTEIVTGSNTGKSRRYSEELFHPRKLSNGRHSRTVRRYRNSNILKECITNRKIVEEELSEPISILKSIHSEETLESPKFQPIVVNNSKHMSEESILDQIRTNLTLRGETRSITPSKSQLKFNYYNDEDTQISKSGFVIRPGTYVVHRKPFIQFDVPIITVLAGKSKSNQVMSTNRDIYEKFPKKSISTSDSKGIKTSALRSNLDIVKIQLRTKCFGSSTNSNFTKQRPKNFLPPGAILRIVQAKKIEQDNYTYNERIRNAKPSRDIADAFRSQQKIKY